MKGMLINIDELIRNSLNQTNGTVSWETIAMKIAGGAKRVQPVSAKSIAKYVMSTFGAMYTSCHEKNNQPDPLTESDDTPECLRGRQTPRTRIWLNIQFKRQTAIRLREASNKT